MKKGWCIPPKANAEFVAAMEDVLEVYQRPFDAARPLICLDEAAKQLLGEVRAPLPMAPGQPGRVDGEYTRQGTAALFMLCEPLAGQRQVFVRAQRRRADFAALIKTLCAELHPRAAKIVLVMDQLERPRSRQPLRGVPTRAGAMSSATARNPPHAQARLVAEHGRDRTGACRPVSVWPSAWDNQEHLSQEVTAWQHARNVAACKADWRFTTTDARIKLKRLYPIILP